MVFLSFFQALKIAEGTLRILHALRPVDKESIFEGHFIFSVGIAYLPMKINMNSLVITGGL
jgi:hypothetical protein